MNLHTRARRFYSLEITTDPELVGNSWEASFDDGTTWFPAIEVEGLPSWLVAGPDADLGDAVAVISAPVEPLVRSIVAPEILVEETPGIRLT